MAGELDPRLLRIGVEIDGRLQRYEDLAMTAKGCKYANPLQNDCEVTITNLARATRDYIVTNASPFNKHKVRKRLIVEAGRKSYGYSTVYEGDIGSVCVAQPPDITLTIKAATGDYLKGQIVQRTKGAQSSMLQIAQGVAKDLGASLRFEAKDKNVGNYSFTGGALRQVDCLCNHGGVNAYMDDGALVVKDYGVPLRGQTRVLNLDTGLIGIPEFTEHGVKVKMLFDNQTKLGSGLQITSRLNPAANGLYAVYKLGFELATRDTPFYLEAEASRV